MYTRRNILSVMIALLVGLGALTVHVSTTSACPSCSEAALSADSGDEAVVSMDADGNAIKPALGEGFYYSILLMLAVPFTMFGTFGYFVWQYARDHQAKGVATTGQTP